MEASICFYDIKKFGYYENSIHRLGDPVEILENLKVWIQGKELNETQTYNVDFENNPKNILRTFCYSVDSRDDEFLVAMWNESTTVDGKMASVDSHGIAGVAAVASVKPLPGYIPGYPAFFWFIPQKKAFATIRFNTPLNGRANLEPYLQGFLTTRSNNVIFEKGDNNEFKIIGYGTSVDDCNLFTPRFSSVRCACPGQVDFIRKSRASIRKIIKKDKFVQERKEATTLWQSMYHNTVGKPTTSTCKNNCKFLFELNMTPTPEELDDIITQYHQDFLAYEMADIGFEFTNNPKKYWLRQSIASDNVELDINFMKQNVFVPTDKLLLELQRKRDQLLPLLNKRKKTRKAE